MARRRGRRNKGIVVVPIREHNIWEDLTRRIRDEQLIPIISNAFVNNLIFDIDFDYNIGLRDQTEALYEDDLTINEELAESWAKSIKYPLAEEPFRLSRVAQYNHIINEHTQEAKAKYLEFLKGYLLVLAREDQNVSHLVDTLQNQIDELSFADIATELGYPPFQDERDHPARLLAELPLKIYITTSHHNFLERALTAVGKEPQTQICSWHLETPESRPAYKRPTIKEPLVYHLYGIEENPASIVISEDDYMDFLVRVSEDKDVIPVQLRGAMAESSLLLLGYRLRDWDFKVLLRGIIKPSTLHGSNVAIQFDQRAQQWDDANKDAKQQARHYLEEYFKEVSNLKVEWDDACDFVRRLSQKWEESQR